MLFVLFLLLIFLFSFHQIKDSDTFYHIKTGQVIIESGHVPTADIFSYTAPGAMWVTHEWLAEIVFYLVSSSFGFWALIGFAALLASLSYFFIVRLAIKKGANVYVTLLVGFIIAYSSISFWQTRPEVIATFLLVLLIYCLEKYREHPRVLYLVPTLFIVWLWANIHASFLLGLVVLIFYTIALKIQLKFPRYFGRTILTIKQTNYLAGATLLSLGLSFLNPNTYRIFLYAFYVRELAKIFNITQYRPALSALSSPIVQAFLVEFIVFGALLVWYFCVRKESRDLGTLGLFLGVSILPFLSARYIIFWPFVVIVPLAVAISSAFSGTVEKLSPKLLPILLSIFGVLFLVKAIMMLPDSPVSNITLPVDAVNFIKHNGIQGPLFNDYSDGGYLIWALWPQEKVAIDGRSEVFRGQPVQDYLSVIDLNSNWQQIIDQKYKINYVILPYWEQFIVIDDNPLFTALYHDNFRMIYWDGHSVIMMKNTPANASLIQKYGTTYVDPFVQPESVTANLSQTEAELKVLVARFPDVLNIQDYLARFSQAHNLP